MRNGRPSDGLSAWPAPRPEPKLSLPVEVKKPLAPTVVAPVPPEPLRARVIFSVEEFLKLAKQNPDLELIGGVAREKPGKELDHSGLQAELITLLNTDLIIRRGFRVMPELREHTLDMLVERHEDVRLARKQVALNGKRLWHLPGGEHVLSKARRRAIAWVPHARDGLYTSGSRQFGWGW